MLAWPDQREHDQQEQEKDEHLKGVPVADPKHQRLRACPALFGKVAAGIRTATTACCRGPLLEEERRNVSLSAACGFQLVAAGPPKLQQRAVVEFRFCDVGLVPDVGGCTILVIQSADQVGVGGRSIAFGRQAAAAHRLRHELVPEAARPAAAFLASSTGYQQQKRQPALPEAPSGARTVLVTPTWSRVSVSWGCTVWLCFSRCSTCLCCTSLPYPCSRRCVRRRRPPQTLAVLPPVRR